MRKPFTNVCPTVRSHWFGKKTSTVYDADGRKICIVPAFPVRSLEESRETASAIAEIFNNVKEMPNTNTKGIDL